MCVNGEKVPTDNTCLTEFDEETQQTTPGPVNQGGSIVKFPVVEKIPVINTLVSGTVDEKNKVYTYGAIAVVVIGGGFYLYSLRNPKGKRRRKK
jgi:hypothetical protein